MTIWTEDRQFLSFRLWQRSLTTKKTLLDGNPAGAGDKPARSLAARVRPIKPYLLRRALVPRHSSPPQLSYGSASMYSPASPSTPPCGSLTWVPHTRVDVGLSAERLLYSARRTRGIVRGDIQNASSLLFLKLLQVIEVAPHASHIVGGSVHERLGSEGFGCSRGLQLGQVAFVVNVGIVSLQQVAAGRGIRFSAWHRRWQWQSVIRIFVKQHVTVGKSQ